MYSITQHFLQDETNLLTRPLLVHRDVKDDCFMYVLPDGTTESFVLAAVDKVIADVIQADGAQTASGLSERWKEFLSNDDDRLQALEFRLRWPSPKAPRSIYSLELHIRVGKRDEDGADEEPIPIPVRRSADITSDMYEHWIKIKRCRQQNKITVERYHTSMRPNFNSEDTGDSGQIKDIRFLQKLTVPITSVLWTSLWVDHKRWPFGTSSAIPEDRDMQEVTDDLQIRTSQMKVQYCYTGCSGCFTKPWPRWFHEMMIRFPEEDVNCRKRSRSCV